MSERANQHVAWSAERARRAAKVHRRWTRERRGLETKLADADRLIAKRSVQLGDAATRRATLAARLAKLPDDTSLPLAYCLKDRLRVTLRDARPMVLTNGRTAVGGLCPICGSRVVRLAGA